MDGNRKLGVHTSISGGLHMGLLRGRDAGCGTVQIFSHNPRAWAVGEIPPEDAELFREHRRATAMDPVYVHTSYLINIASPKDELRSKSTGLLREEMRRADIIGADFVVLHTGVAYDAEGRLRAAESIREVLGGGGFKAGLLLENTAGRRGDVASDIAGLAEIMDGSGGLAAGVCIDSCHAFAAGYDLSCGEGTRALAREVEELLGPGAVKLLHLNDSRGAAGSHIDRHEHLGKGEIGLDGLGGFIGHPTFACVPIVLETPKRNDGDDVENLAVARKLIGGF